MKSIPLTKGKYALVDDEDYEVVAQHKWHALEICGIFYAGRSGKKGEKKSYTYMHRAILGEPLGLVDHKNGDGLDNRKDNLRLATRKTNAQNRGKQSNNTSGLKGVSFHKRAQKWIAEVDGEYLGIFGTKEEAHRVYCETATAIHGEFFRT